jgi:hypothetical protein
MDDNFNLLDVDRVVEIATKIIRISHRGDQYFVDFLRVPEAAELRAALLELVEVFRDEIPDE